MLEFKHTIEEKAYNDMRELVGWRRLDPQQAQTGLDNSVFTTVAYDAKTPVGMARLVGDGGYMYLIVDVMVHPDYQKQGLGRALLERINAYLDDLASDGRVIMVNLMAGSTGEVRKMRRVKLRQMFHNIIDEIRRKEYPKSVRR